MRFERPLLALILAAVDAPTLSACIGSTGKASPNGKKATGGTATVALEGGYKDNWFDPIPLRSDVQDLGCHDSPALGSGDRTHQFACNFPLPAGTNHVAVPPTISATKVVE